MQPPLLDRRPACWAGDISAALPGGPYRRALLQEAKEYLSADLFSPQAPHQVEEFLPAGLFLRQTHRPAEE